ncbi:hypothetical protein Tco_1380009 [Tanacetum coccineum]
MTTLKYSDKHNMVAFLKKPNESMGFTEIVDFLKGTSLRYALSHNPTIYDSLVKQFWHTATVRTLANRTQELVASIDNKEYTITEAFVRSKLQLPDAAGISNLPDADIYDGLATLGYASEGDHVPLLPIMLAGAAEDQGEGSAIPVEPQHTPVDPVPFTSQPPTPSTNEPLQQPSPPRQSDRQDTKIPQSQGLTFTHVVDKATTTGVRVGTKGATTTTSGLDAGLYSGNIHESPLKSHDTPLHDVNTSGSVEDSLKLKELSLLVPKLELKIGSLEKELKETKQTFGNVILTFVDRVKSLEVALKRKSKKVILSESKDEETENQGRKIHDIDDDPLVSLVRDFVTPTKIKVSALGEAQEEDISPTTMEAAKTLLKVASQKARSTDKGKRYKRRKMSKGKDIITGLDAEVKVYLDDMVAKRVQEEEELTDQQAQRMAQVHETAQYYTEEDWDNIRAKLEANAKLVKDVLGKDMSSEDYVKRMAQQRDYMSTFIKNQSTWKLAQLKKLTFEELKTEFEKLVKSIESFVPIGSEERVKRQGIQLEQETSKKQKIAIEDVLEEKDDEPVKKIGKRKKQIARKGIHIDKTEKDEVEEDMEAIEKGDPSSGTNIPVNPIPVAIKPPSIANYKIIKLGKKGVYYIVREDGTGKDIKDKKKQNQ